MRHWFSLSLLCCAPLLVSGCADLNAPTISYPGLSTTAITSNTISIAWSKASDGLSPPTALVYKVYLSGANPVYQSFDTIAEVENTGTLVATLTDASSTTITTGLAAGNSYYINIVVQDEEGNKAVYDPLGEYFHASLLSYYPFSGNAYDVTAALNHLVLATGISTTTLALPYPALDRFGHPASAYNFAATATSSHCLQSTVNIGITGASPRTVSFWVQSANTTTTQRVPFAWGDGSIAGSAFAAYETGTGSNWMVWLGGATTVSTASAVTTDWEHWVIGYNGTNVLAYKNGVSAGSTAATAATVDGLLYVGCGANPAGTLVDPYLGKIDDLQIFDVLLDTAEVASLYNATRP